MLHYKFLLQSWGQALQPFWGFLIKVVVFFFNSGFYYKDDTFKAAQPQLTHIWIPPNEEQNPLITGKFYREIEKGFFHHLRPGMSCSPGHSDTKMTQLGLRPHNTNSWQFSLPIEGKEGGMAVLLDTFHCNGVHCSSMWLLPLLLFMDNYQFVSSYCNSLHWEINISYMELCGGSRVLLQQTTAICPDCSSDKAEGKCHASPITLPKVSREWQCVLPHLISDKNITAWICKQELPHPLLGVRT